MIRVAFQNRLIKKEYEVLPPQIYTDVYPLRPTNYRTFENYVRNVRQLFSKVPINVTS